MPRNKPVRTYFYAGVTDLTNRMLSAADIDGVDEEVAFLRGYVRKYADEHPEEFDRVIKGVKEIVNAVKEKYRLSRANATSLTVALKEMAASLRDEVLPPIDDV